MATSSKTSSRPSKPFTLDHFRGFYRVLVFEDGETRELEPWQAGFAKDVFAGTRELWLIVPEGNGKSTFLAALGLYGLHYSREPWIPVGAASRDQAEIIYGQAAGFIRRTEAIKPYFRAYDGYRKIISKKNGGKGMKVYPHDPKTGDGVIPYPFALVDEPHRHPDMRLYGLWKGKLRKRKAQILVISTAGEPGAPFEEMREKIRIQATKRKRNGSFLRAEGSGLVLHEYMVQSDEDCADVVAVKAANPLEALTLEDLEVEFNSPTLDIGEWKRFKCNRPTRSARVAVSDREWEDAEVKEGIPAGSPIDVGFDVAWKWDTTALDPLWGGPEYHLLGAPKILVPPRDGSSMHPDEIKFAFEELRELNPIQVVVMDTSKAEDISHWLEDDFGVEVIDRGQSNDLACADYEAFMGGLRNGSLKHVGDRGLTQHVMNAIARRLPGGDYRFDRPSTTRQTKTEQDRRVIDALTAAGMVVEHQSRKVSPSESVYRKRELAAA